MNMAAISILIVEDESMTALFMGTMLKRKGYNVLKCVSSGEEAVEAALNLNPDLVLIDIRLAGKMDGIEAVSKIKKKSQAAVEFIFTTGYADSEFRESAMELEPLAYLIKPVRLQEIVNIINSFFQNEGI